VGMRVGNYDQLSSVHLTPTANVAVSEFHEIHGAVEFRLPFLSADLPLACVYLHKRTGADQRKERVVFQTDVAVHGFTQIQMLQKADGDLIPLRNDPRKQVRSLQSEFWLELHWQRHFLGLKIGSSIQKMRFRNSDESTIAAQITNR